MTDGSLNGNTIKMKLTINKTQLKNTMKHKGLMSLTVMLVAGAMTANAQDEKFGAEPDKCRENISLYREYFKQKNYDDAMPGWRWAFQNCPAASKNIVINGPTLMQHMVEKNKDNAAVKQAYLDTLYQIYDKRIQLFPEDEGYALGRKGIDQYENATEDFLPAYETLKKSLEKGKNETEANVVLRLYQAAMKLLVDKKLEVEVLFALYDEVSGVIDFNLAKGAEDKSYKFYEQAKEIVDQNFERIAQEDQYVALMKPKVEAAPSDTTLLTKVSTMMVKRKWTANPFYLTTSEKLYKLSPSATAAYNLYEGYVKVDNLSEAGKFLDEAVKLEKDPNTKAEYLMRQAQILGSKGAYAAARVKANEAAGLKPGWGDPYIYIGSLYLSTSSSCGSDACSQTYGYWAAEDMFIKARSVDANVASEAAGKIAQARKYFPTQKDCFFLGIQEGQTVTVGGWIGAETKARFAN
jgi:tetratricopeptide (TPR) repeat protein